LVLENGEIEIIGDVRLRSWNKTSFG
jgi:hypothetical protein